MFGEMLAVMRRLVIVVPQYIRKHRNRKPATLAMHVAFVRNAGTPAAFAHGILLTRYLIVPMSFRKPLSVRRGDPPPQYPRKARHFLKAAHHLQEFLLAMRRRFGTEDLSE